jgi:hypothetical protein
MATHTHDHAQLCVVIFTTVDHADYNSYVAASNPAPPALLHA